MKLGHRRTNSPTLHRLKIPTRSSTFVTGPIQFASPLDSSNNSVSDYTPQYAPTPPRSSSPRSLPQPTIHSIYNEASKSWTYLVADPVTEEAVVINPALELSFTSSSTSTSSDPPTQPPPHTALDAIVVKTLSTDQLLDLIGSEGYTVTRIIETHIHRRHASASRYLQRKLQVMQDPDVVPLICIGKEIEDEGKRIEKRFGARDGGEGPRFDHLISDGEKFGIGNLQALAMDLPGEAQRHVGYIIGSNLFIGDDVVFDEDQSKVARVLEPTDEQETIGPANEGLRRSDREDGSMQAKLSKERLLALPASWKVYGYPGITAERTYLTHETQNDVEDNEGDERSLADSTASTRPIACLTIFQLRQMMSQQTSSTSGDSSIKASLSPENYPTLTQCALQVNLRGGRIPKSFKLFDPDAEGEEKIIRDISVVLPRGWDGL